jgi:hypothetical protein
MRPALVVSIDTEEEGLWSGAYRPSGNSCRNIGWLPPVHAMFTRLTVRPTYLVDHPVSTDATARSILRELAADGNAEIGAHLHPWCTPPLHPDGVRSVDTYAHQLAPELQEAKLSRLCQAIEETVGARPTSYRAGRWGFGHSTVPVLERLGFAVDSSVWPLWWDRDRGGPSFRRAPQRPYRLGRRDVTRAGDSSVVEVPASAGFIGRRSAALEEATRLLPELPGMRRWLVRLGLAALQPEGYSLATMCALVDEQVARGAAVLNVVFHSTALMPGATPFVRDERERLAFLARLEGVLVHALERHGARPLCLSDVPYYAGLNAAGAADRTPAAASLAAAAGQSLLRTRG